MFFRVFSIDYIVEKKKIACLMIKREKNTISIDCHNLWEIINYSALQYKIPYESLFSCVVFFLLLILWNLSLGLIAFTDSKE